MESKSAKYWESIRRVSTIGAWNVVRRRKKYIPAAHHTDGTIEYANIAFNTPEEAQEFCDAACEMLEKGKSK